VFNSFIPRILFKIIVYISSLLTFRRKEQTSEAWGENMPFDLEWSGAQFVTAVKYIISKTIESVYPGENSAKKFVGDLVRTRFAPLYKNSSAVDLLTGECTLL